MGSGVLNYKGPPSLELNDLQQARRPAVRATATKTAPQGSPTDRHKFASKERCASEKKASTLFPSRRREAIYVTVIPPLTWLTA